MLKLLLVGIWKLLSTMNAKILKNLVKARNVLKRKLRTIKIGESDVRKQLNETFKPITDPLQDLITTTKNKKESDRYECKLKNQKESLIDNQLSTILESSTPKKSIEDTLLNKSKSIDDDDDDDDFYSQSDTIENSSFSTNYPNLSLLESSNELDTLYGPHKDSNNRWKFGNSNIQFEDDKILIGNQIWALTPGLFSLMFHKKPRNYDKSELQIYKNILINTNAYKRDYKSDAQIKGTRAYKYKHIIGKLFKDKSYSHSENSLAKRNYVGTGIMKLNSNKPNYIYWDDPNELVDRLRLLIASQAAGHSNHNNEIVSIIEELYEANLIE